MVEQDHLHTEDCVFFANKAIDALKSGYTSREVEKALRAIRMAIKKADGTPENSYERYQITMAINDLISMKWISVAATENMEQSRSLSYKQHSFRLHWHSPRLLI